MLHVNAQLLLLPLLNGVLNQGARTMNFAEEVRTMNIVEEVRMMNFAEDSQVTIQLSLRCSQ